MTKLPVIRSLQAILIAAILSGSFATSLHAQSKETVPEKFIRLLNQFNRDSLDLITTPDFTMEEITAQQSWSKTGFLDSFFRASKAINGTFSIVETRNLSADFTTFLVDDHNDFQRYLKPGNRLQWLLTVHSKENLVTRVVADSVYGNKEYVEDFAKKQQDFFAWLNQKYPGDTPAQLSRESKMIIRLQEFADRKD